MFTTIVVNMASIHPKLTQNLISTQFMNLIGILLSNNIETLLY